MMKIKIDYRLRPDVSCMLQAYYSRSHKSINDRLENLDEEKTLKSLKQYYTKVGHASIGQGGFFTIYLEGVSLLAAKAIQDHQLYIGQESSTRYIDFSNNQLYSDSSTLSAELLNFFKNNFNHQKEFLRETKQFYPVNHPKWEKKQEKTLEALTFDVMRGVLPASVTTNLSWTTNFSHCYEHLHRLLGHPLDEVKLIALRIIREIKREFPGIMPKLINETIDFYLSAPYLHYYQFPADQFPAEPTPTKIRHRGVEHIPYGLQTLPQSNFILPKELNFFGEIYLNSTLDFGSFRDYQRHRSITTAMPLLTNKLNAEKQQINANKHYINALLPDLKTRFIDMLLKHHNSSTDTVRNKYLSQYDVPLCTNVPVRSVGHIPGFIYLIRLRSSPTVHPTLRNMIQEVQELFEKEFGFVFPEKSQKDKFKRGLQDIEDSDR